MNITLCQCVCALGNKPRANWGTLQSEGSTTDTVQLNDFKSLLPIPPSTLYM